MQLCFLSYGITMNPYLSAFVLSVPMVVAAPYVAAETHPAQAQMQQNIDAVLKIARNGSLSEALSGLRTYFRFGSRRALA